MSQSEEQLLMLDIEELNEMLRDEPVLAGLRQALARRGLSSAEVLLAGFMEDEENGEYGAIVTKSGDVYEYERDTGPEAPADFKKFEPVEDVDELIRDASGCRGRPAAGGQDAVITI